MTTVTLTPDIAYAQVDDTALRLDIYRPDIEGLVPAVVYLHGGGWQRGDRAADGPARLRPLAAHGVAVVSAQYRLVPGAVFPAQVHDVKAAVRWVRGHGAEYGLSTDRVGLWGASAGAMLAALVALTPADAELEGTVGNDTGQSSAAQAVVDWFGPADFVTTASRSPLESVILPPRFELALFGPGSDEEIAATARNASPIGRITADAPPFLIMHGDRDRMIPVAESQAFHDALSRAGASSTFVSLAGAGHDDPAFGSAPNIAMTAAFLLATLMPSAT